MAAKHSGEQSAHVRNPRTFDGRDKSRKSGLSSKRKHPRTSYPHTGVFLKRHDSPRRESDP